MKTPHVHRWIEIMYVVNGKCQIEFPQKSIAMKSGEFVFISSDIPHRLVVEEPQPCRMLNVEFGFEKSRDTVFSMEKLIHSNQTLKSMIE